MLISRTPSAFYAANSSAAATEAALPEWNLDDHYPGMDSPAFAADLKKASVQCNAFAADYRGKLDAIARAPDASTQLFNVLKRYEALDDLLGRIGSYAGLLYAGDTSDPQRAKFYGDAQEKLTNATTELLFFALELNRIEDAVLDKAAAEAPLNRFKPWLEDVRAEKPYQLDDRIEQLFHEKSISGASAWNRLFDETIASLRFKVGEQELTIAPTLHMMQDADGEKRKQAADAIVVTLQANLRTFALITNTLAKDKEISDRWRGFKDIADSRHLSNRVEREVVDALVAAVRDAYPRLSHRYYKLKAKWFGRTELDFWDRSAPLPDTPMQNIRWDEARNIVLSAYGDFSPKMASIAQRFFDERWIDAPARAGKSPGARRCMSWMWRRVVGWWNCRGGWR